MKVNWLLEEDIFQENMESFKKAIIDQGMNFATTRFTPFGEREFLDRFNENDCVITYGSLQLAQAVLSKSKWVPGAWCNLKNFECTHYYPHLGEFLLNDKYVMLPFGELLRQKDFLFDTIGENGKLFVRPSSGFKYFTGQLISADQYQKDVDCLAFYDIESEKVVVCSKPQVITEEWRLVVVDKQIITGTRYKLDFKLSPLGDQADWCDVYDFGKSIAQKWQPETAYVLDIGRTDKEELKLIEINSFSSSGLYSCEIPTIVKHISKAAIKEWEDLYGHQ